MTVTQQQTRTPTLRKGANSFPRSQIALARTSSRAVSTPRFSQQQQVCFIGGSGTIESCHLDSGAWTYVVVMPFAPNPNLGRAGGETTVLLDEIDIHTC